MGGTTPGRGELSLDWKRPLTAEEREVLLNNTLAAINKVKESLPQKGKIKFSVDGVRACSPEPGAVVLIPDDGNFWIELDIAGMLREGTLTAPFYKGNIWLVLGDLEEKNALVVHFALLPIRPHTTHTPAVVGIFEKQSLASLQYGLAHLTCKVERDEVGSVKGEERLSHRAILGMSVNFPNKVVDRIFPDKAFIALQPGRLPNELIGEADEIQRRWDMLGEIPELTVDARDLRTIFELAEKAIKQARVG